MYSRELEVGPYTEPGFEQGDSRVPPPRTKKDMPPSHELAINRPTAFGKDKPLFLEEDAAAPEVLQVGPQKFQTGKRTSMIKPTLEQKIIGSRDIDTNTDLRAERPPNVRSKMYTSQFTGTQDEGILRRAEMGSELRGLFNDKPGRVITEEDFDRWEPFPYDDPAFPNWSKVPSNQAESSRPYDRLQ